MWDAAKATLRCFLLEKAMEAHMLELERELERCEKVHEQSPDSATWSQPKTAKVNLTVLLVLPAHKLAGFRLQHYYQIARQRHSSFQNNKNVPN
jgi:hypothetical protein